MINILKLKLKFKIITISIAFEDTYKTPIYNFSMLLTGFLLNWFLIMFIYGANIIIILYTTNLEEKK